MEQFFLVAGALATIFAIGDVVLKIRKSYWHAFYVLISCLMTVFAFHYWSNLKRVNDIARSADFLVANKQMEFTARGYVEAVLSFLEKNKDIYPDTYARAVAACQHYKCDQPGSEVDINDLSFAFDGIVKGIGSLSTTK